MDRKIALKWARALESGEYKQTSETLRDSNGFCCLGVLCNLHAQAHPETAANETDPYSYMGEIVELPIAVMRWSGMTSRVGYLPNDVNITNENGHRVFDLATVNDEIKYNFKQIAKIIREHSNGL